MTFELIMASHTVMQNKNYESHFPHDVTHTLLQKKHNQ